ncbi:carboxypeptidase-like regulatory domain-containing protein [Flavobacterium sp.]|uniref:carboxypeptidase-like regulatory domain-containing protein n=1 Tax=Flavobacterium sp. TaxID=239 RepID=UPI002486FC11|nr:carboxypeptidase-like regulatory domain-containing protein [Flavobacterium sp.]MDI1317567.1 carboxypeptidase-like regulatory domain-containing protein [Flavobacterium sp.]
MKVILFLFFTFSISAQIKGVVIDENNKPISFVNIWVEDESIGTTSQENGTFSIDISSEKTVVFSAVGFETKRMTISDKQKVVLKEAVFKLEEVVIEKSKQTKELEIGGMKKIHHRQLSGDNPWIYAKRFNYDENYKATPFIKNIVFYSDSEIKNAKLKIRIFQLQDSLPANDLIEEDIIVSVKKGMKKNVIDISKYKLKMPKNGVVIGLEWLIIAENYYEFKYQDSKKKRITMPNYQPSLVVNYFEERNAFNYRGGKWYWSYITNTNGNHPWTNKIMTPAINLILTN